MKFIRYPKTDSWEEGSWYDLFLEVVYFAFRVFIVFLFGFLGLWSFALIVSQNFILKLTPECQQQVVNSV